MNKILITGNVTGDPVSTTVKGDRQLCKFTVAVNKFQKGEKAADFYICSAFGKLGEECQQTLSKGTKVFVMGSFSPYQYQGKDGATKTLLNVTAEECIPISGHSRTTAAPQEEEGEAGQEKAAFEAAGFIPVDDELPF